MVTARALCVAVLVLAGCSPVSSGATIVYSSFNDGLTWTTKALFGDGGLGLSDLGFTTPMQGVVIHGQAQYPESLQLLMTRDGGHRWSAVNVYPG